MDYRCLMRLLNTVAVEKRILLSLQLNLPLLRIHSQGDSLSAILGNLGILVHFRHSFITNTVKPFYSTTTSGVGLNR